jgi:hypothetical protein
MKGNHRENPQETTKMEEKQPDKDDILKKQQQPTEEQNRGSNPAPSINVLALRVCACNADRPLYLEPNMIDVLGVGFDV